MFLFNSQSTRESKQELKDDPIQSLRLEEETEAQRIEIASSGGSDYKRKVSLALSL